MRGYSGSIYFAQKLNYFLLFSNRIPVVVYFSHLIYINE